jgi:hypothetical protein
MIAYLLFALSTTHQGGAPTNWQHLMGEPAVKYRWSRPESNSCLMEFTSDDRGTALSFEVIASVISNRSQTALGKQRTSFGRTTSAPVVPRTSDRTIPVELTRMGRNVMDIQDCYGIEAVKVHGGASDSEPLSKPTAK